MSAVGWKATSTELSTGTSAKTLLQIVAASNHRITINEWTLHCKGTTSNNAPLRVRILRQTTAGTMTANNPVKANNSDDETLQTTGQRNATAEPTAGDVLDEVEVHPQLGYTWQSPSPDNHIIVKGGDRLGLEVLAADDVTAVATFKGEE